MTGPESEPVPAIARLRGLASVTRHQPSGFPLKTAGMTGRGRRAYTRGRRAYVRGWRTYVRGTPGLREGTPGWTRGERRAGRKGDGGLDARGTADLMRGERSGRILKGGNRVRDVLNEGGFLTWLGGWFRIYLRRTRASARQNGTVVYSGCPGVPQSGCIAQRPSATIPLQFLARSFRARR